MKKLICHCGKVELEIKESEGALNKFLRCNCTLCKKKGYIMTFAPITDVKIKKGEDKLKLYQYHTKVAEHYFCSECGIYTHHKICLLYTSPSPRDMTGSRMPSSA